MFDVEYADRLSTGLNRLAAGGIDAVLLDLSLPDSHGLDTFVKMHDQVPEVPIVVLTGLNDEGLAVEAVQWGAQDYLVKGQVDGDLLVRALRYAIERHRLLAELRAMSLVDALTGLYNRRGFLTLAEQQLKLAHRMDKGMLLLFADLDGMKWINDTFGHQEGDRALIAAADVLRETFRESDIAARIGGDEFVVLAVEAPEDSAEALILRLREGLRTHHGTGDCGYELAMSVGIACYDPKNPCSIDNLLAQADSLMYEEKRGKDGR